MSRYFILLLVTAIFSCCQDFVENIQIIDRYHLVAVDVDTDMSLSYKLEDGNYLGIVDQTVFAVGFNDDYLIAKQHPDNNRNIINYFIVPVYKDYTLFPEKDLIGPLSFAQFEEKSKELNIAELAFTKEIDKLK